MSDPVKTIKNDNPDLPADVFGEIDSDWNVKRRELEDVVLKAAAELMRHAGCDSASISGHGVTAELSPYEVH